jgi:hypothetical protein
MRGISECYLCGGKLDDRLNIFDASGILTHHLCPMKRFRDTGRTPTGHALHLWGAGRTACGRDAKRTGNSLAFVSCQRCQQASTSEVHRSVRAS